MDLLMAETAAGVLTFPCSDTTGDPDDCKHELDIRPAIRRQQDGWLAFNIDPDNVYGPAVWLSLEQIVLLRDKLTAHIWAQHDRIDAQSEE